MKGILSSLLFLNLAFCLRSFINILTLKVVFPKNYQSLIDCPVDQLFSLDVYLRDIESKLPPFLFSNYEEILAQISLFEELTNSVQNISSGYLEDLGNLKIYVWACRKFVVLKAY